MNDLYFIFFLSFFPSVVLRTYKCDLIPGQSIAKRTNKKNPIEFVYLSMNFSLNPPWIWHWSILSNDFSLNLFFYFGVRNQMETIEWPWIALKWYLNDHLMTYFAIKFYRLRRMFFVSNFGNLHTKQGWQQWFTEW